MKCEVEVEVGRRRRTKIELCMIYCFYYLCLRSLSVNKVSGERGETKISAGQAKL